MATYQGRQCAFESCETTVQFKYTLRLLKISYCEGGAHFALSACRKSICGFEKVY
jgi:hypothetical protein